MANYEIGFWIVIGLLGVSFILLIVFLVLAAVQIPVSRDSVLRLDGIPVSHNGRTDMSVLLNLAYKTDARVDRLVDQTNAVSTINSVMNSGSFQDGTPWDKVAEELGMQFYNDYDVSGISVQILVFYGEDGTELVGPTYSKGTITKLQKFE